MAIVRPALRAFIFVVCCCKVCAFREKRGGGIIAYNWSAVIEEEFKLLRAFEGEPTRRVRSFKPLKAYIDTFSKKDEKKGIDDHEHDQDSLPPRSVRAIQDTGEETAPKAEASAEASVPETKDIDIPSAHALQESGDEFVPMPNVEASTEASVPKTKDIDTPSVHNETEPKVEAYIDTFSKKDEEKGIDNHEHDQDSLPPRSVRAIQETGEETAPKAEASAEASVPETKDIDIPSVHALQESGDETEPNVEAPTEASVPETKDIDTPSVHNETEPKVEALADASVLEILPAVPNSLGELKRVPTTCVPRAARKGRRVVSMADQHGDFQHMLVHLQLLGLVGNHVTNDKGTWRRNMWIGENAIFIQTGDIISRGPDGKLMYHFLWALQDDAAKSSGEVVLLLGNHKFLALQGDVRYVTNHDFCQYTSKCKQQDLSEHKLCGQHRYCCTSDTLQPPRQNTCSSCMPGNCEFLWEWDIGGEMGNEIRMRLRTGHMKILHKEDDVIYVHAGLLQEFYGQFMQSPNHMSIDSINQYAANYFGSKSMAALNALKDNDLLTDDYSPVWTRVCDWHIWGNPHGQCQAISAALFFMEARAMVIGHCPQQDGTKREQSGIGSNDGMRGSISRLCGGTFIVADTFMSIAYAHTEEAAVHNMAAVELSTGDATKTIYSRYSGRNGRNRCSTD